jgi:hypothetical protein
MEDARPQMPMPPGDLRPAQLGIVFLGRVIFGHITATLVDLAERGLLRLEETKANGRPDWTLTDLRAHAHAGRELLDFETTLLDGLFNGQTSARLSEVSQALIPVLDRARAQIRRDAVRNGRLRRWPRDRRTARGERLLRQIQVFRQELRALAASAGPNALAGLAQYAMLFGLRGESPAGPDARAADRLRSGDTEVAWSKTDRFVRVWLSACAGLSNHLDHGHGAGVGQRGAFAHQWSTPPTHEHGGHGHGSGHGGYGGGSGQFAGGHGAGGHAVGGHSGH